LLLAASFAISACGNSSEDHPPVYPVKGKVLVSGKPMKGGTIIFELDGDGKSALKNPSGGPFRVTGKITNEGTFNLVAFEGTPGAPEGHYKVGILATKGRSESNLFGDRTDIVSKKERPALSTKQYGEPKTSGLTARVTKDGPNEPVFELK
jgi:hypothetical protein